MREWSQESVFPEDNAANYVNGRLDPQAAQARRTGRTTFVPQGTAPDAEVRTIAQQHRPRQSGKK